MSTIRLEQITGSDADLKMALTDARLPTDDIEDGGRTFFKALSADGRIVGFSGVERCDGDYLLRSVVVHPDRRGTGLGKAVVEATVASLDPGSGVFLATTSAAPFFARLGFSEVRRDRPPT
jgi:N-acetylglutamate synthase-like GNAT family acetyltransferase